MKFETVQSGIFGIATLVIWAQLAVVGGLVYTAYHFITKFW